MVHGPFLAGLVVAHRVVVLAGPGMITPLRPLEQTVVLVFQAASQAFPRHTPQAAAVDLVALARPEERQKPAEAVPTMPKLDRLRLPTPAAVAAVVLEAVAITAVPAAPES